MICLMINVYINYNCKYVYTQTDRDCGGLDLLFISISHDVFAVNENNLWTNLQYHYISAADNS